jgi:hypothetical protein
MIGTLTDGVAARVWPNEIRRAVLDDAAREYDATRHGALELVATYHDSGGQRHAVAINLHPELDWRVIDIHPDGTATLVERLPGFDDRRAQAETLARDYARQWRAYLTGERFDPPVLNPASMTMRYRPRRRRR